MAIVQCPKCAAREYVRFEVPTGDRRGCLVCGCQWYPDEDLWQVEPAPTWSTAYVDITPQV